MAHMKRNGDGSKSVTVGTRKKDRESWLGLTIMVKIQSLVTNCNLYFCTFYLSITLLMSYAVTYKVYKNTPNR